MSLILGIAGLWLLAVVGQHFEQRYISKDIERRLAKLK